MDVLKFIANEWDSILIIVLAIVGVLVMIKRGETQKLKSIIFQLVTKAEQEYGSGTGELKYAVVVDWLYQRMPMILKILFTPKDISKMIESVLTYAKGKWGANEELNRYIHEGIIYGTENIKETIQKAADEVIKDEPPKDAVG